LLVLTENKLNKLNTQGCVVLFLKLGTCEALRFNSNSNQPFQFDSIRKWWANSKIVGHACLSLVIVKQLQPLMTL